jgi:hypothetical protein
MEEACEWGRERLVDARAVGERAVVEDAHLILDDTS